MKVCNTSTLSALIEIVWCLHLCCWLIASDSRRLARIRYVSTREIRKRIGIERKERCRTRSCRFEDLGKGSSISLEVLDRFSLPFVDLYELDRCKMNFYTSDLDDPWSIDK